MQLSVQLDGGLSQLERRMVSAHLKRCADCRAFGAAMATFTQELRGAPLETLRYPVVVRRPRRAAIPVRTLGVAATMAIAILGVASQVGTPPAQQQSSTTSQATPVTQFGTLRQLQRELAQVGLFERKRSPGPTAAV